MGKIILNIILSHKTQRKISSVPSTKNGR